MPKHPFAAMSRVEEIFEQVLAQSPADETELVWFERRHGLVSHPAAENATTDDPAVDASPGDDLGPRDRDPGGYVDLLGSERTEVEDPRLTVLVRVVEGGRVGWHRTDIPDPYDLTLGIRQAMAVAKIQPRSKHTPLMSPKAPELNLEIPLYDAEIARLGLEQARARVADWCGDSVAARFHWSETHVAIFNSHGLRRTAATTEASLTATADSGHARGFAAGSARGLDLLDPAAIVERARRRAEVEPVDIERAGAASLPEGPVSVLLAGEAVVELLHVLNTFAFAGRAFLDGDSFLGEHRNVQVFDRAFHLLDDGSRTPGLPFPFDLEGTPKSPIELIVEGKPSTPALSRVQGDRAGLQPTAQSVGGRDSFFGNLFLLAGEASERELASSVGDGLFVGWLDTPECIDPRRLEVRARARGVRRIRDGRLAEPVPDLVWQTGLLAALARLGGIGNTPVVRAMPSTPLGGIAAPAVVLERVEGLSLRD